MSFAYKGEDVAVPPERVLVDRVGQWSRLSDPDMKRIKLAEYLLTVSPVSAAAAVEELLVRTRSKEPDAVAMYLALVQSLVMRQIPENVVAQWRREAFVMGLSEVCYMLSEPPERRPEEYSDEDFPTLHPELQECTLGEKKALARRLRDPDMEKFLHETDPHVLNIFFRHPAVTSKYVVRMLAQRPQREVVFFTAVSGNRWIADKEVQKTVVFNPYAPRRLAIKLLPLLRPREILEVIDSRLLPQGLRGYASLISAAQQTI